MIAGLKHREELQMKSECSADIIPPSRARATPLVSQDELQVRSLILLRPGLV